MTTSGSSSEWRRFPPLQEWPGTALAEVVSASSGSPASLDDPYQLMRSLSVACGWSRDTGSGEKPEYARAPLCDVSDGGSIELVAEGLVKVFLQVSTYAPVVAVAPAFLHGVGDVLRHMGLAASTMLLQLPAGTTSKGLMAAMAQLAWTRPAELSSITVEVDEVLDQAEVLDLVAKAYRRATALALPAFVELAQTSTTGVSFSNVDREFASVEPLIAMWTAVLAESAGEDLGAMRLSIQWA